MSSGLITLVGAGGTSTTLTISRPGGHTTTDAISVSVSAPGAPTAANATAQTSGSLTFPVTLNASGSLPTALAWQYSTTGSAPWTAGSDLTLTSPTLGQVVNETVNVPSASTLYYVQFAEKNSAGTSAFCASVTGTTSAAASFDTTAYNATTGAGIGGSTGTPIQWDTAKNYVDDAHFRAAISNLLTTFSDASKVGTGNPNAGGAFYHDGRFVDLVNLTTAVTYSGDQVFDLRLAATNTNSSTGTGELYTAAPANLSSVWIWIRRNYPAGFTATGDGNSAAAIAFNDPNGGQGGAGVSYKIGPQAGHSSGRAGVDIGGGSSPDVLPLNYFGTLPGISETSINGTLGTVLTDGSWYDWLLRFGGWIGANGNFFIDITMWLRKQGDAHYTRVGKRRVADTGQTALQYHQSLVFTHENYNQARATDLHMYAWGWAGFDETTTADPFGVVAYEAGLTPEAITLGAASNITTSTAAFAVTIGRYAGKLVPVVDGTEQTAQSYTIPRDVPELTMATNGTGTNTPQSITRTVTGLAAGTHTVVFRCYNVNATAHVDSGSQSVTI